MIDSKVVDFFAHRCGARDQLVAEREIVLSYALHLLWEREVCARLAFKGGTALRKLVFGAGGRFSEDLDFTLCTGEREEAAIAIIEALDGREHHGVTFTTPDADPFDAYAFFERIHGGTFDWSELERLLPPGRRVDKGVIAESIERRMGDLRAITDLERRVIADSASGWNEQLADELRS
jgi:hypothetical protein